MLILLCSIIKGYHIRRMWATGVNLCNTFDLLRNDQPQVNLINDYPWQFHFISVSEETPFDMKSPYPDTPWSIDDMITPLRYLVLIHTIFCELIRYITPIFATFYTSGDAPAVFVNWKLTNLKYKSLTGYLTNLPDRSISDLLHRAFDQMSWTYRPSWRRR